MSQDKNKSRSRPRNWGQNQRRQWEPLEEARLLQQRIDEQIALNEQAQEAHDAGHNVTIPGTGLQSIRDPLLDNPSHYFEFNARQRGITRQRTGRDRTEPDLRQRASRQRTGTRPRHGELDIRPRNQPTLPQLAIDGNILTPHNPNREGEQRRAQAVAEALRLSTSTNELDPDFARFNNTGFNANNRSGGEAARQRAEAAAEALAQRTRAARNITQTHLRDVTGGPLDFTPPPTQATNPQDRRPGPGQPTPTPMQIDDIDDEPMGPNVQETAQPGNNIGRQGALQSGGGQKYNYLPRSINEKYFTLSFQHMVRYDLVSRAENFGVLTPSAADMWNGSPGSLRTSEWRYIPNQTWELYLTPVQSRQILDLVGWGGEIKPERCGIHIMNTRLAMQLPQETGFLITVDKPYFKVYEDKPRELFGHGYTGQPVAQIYPSVNALSTTFTHGGKQNLEPVDLPQYVHTMPGVVANDATTLAETQLNLESSGGIEFYQPGDSFAKSWDLNADFTPIQGLTGTGYSGQVNAAEAGAFSVLTGYLGYTLGNKNITNYNTDTSKTISLDFARSAASPNMVLITIPDVNSVNIGAGTFNITSELQMNVTYNIVVSVHRYDDPNFTASITTHAPSGSQVIEAANAYKTMRKQRGDGVYISSRPAYGSYTF
uniref:Uncharacterized protein n=1 Tax=Turdus pallidus parvoviridae sp. TaxID=2794526 RepID=A0A8A4XEH6_9VIRU|nr:MAG: hypothetical protein [Turdus pallidus parvoviridae sp.]